MWQRGELGRVHTTISLYYLCNFLWICSYLKIKTFKNAINVKPPQKFRKMYKWCWKQWRCNAKCKPKRDRVIMAMTKKDTWRFHPIPPNKQFNQVFIENLVHKRHSAIESESVSVARLCGGSLPPHWLSPTRFLCSWGCPGKNIGVCCHALLQGIFPTQGSNLGVRQCRQILHRLSHQGSSIKDSWIKKKARSSIYLWITLLSKKIKQNNY